METATVTEGDSSTYMVLSFSAPTKDLAMKRGLLHLDPFLDPDNNFQNNHPYEYPRHKD